MQEFFKNANKMFVGFEPVMDRMNSFMEQTAKLATSNWPPYNIKKIDDNKYIIEVAVAGFGRQDIDIELDDGKLVIKGNVKSGEPSEQDSNGMWTFPQVLYKGLAMRPFTRQFALADNVVINGAEMLNGILKIVLETIIPEHKKPTKIEISEVGEK